MKWSPLKHVFSILPSHPGVHIKCLLVKGYSGNSGKGDCKDNFHSSGFCLHFLYDCAIEKLQISCYVKLEHVVYSQYFSFFFVVQFFYNQGHQS